MSKFDRGVFIFIGLGIWALAKLIINVAQTLNVDFIVLKHQTINTFCSLSKIYCWATIISRTSFSRGHLFKYLVQGRFCPQSALSVNHFNHRYPLSTSGVAVAFGPRGNRFISIPKLSAVCKSLLI